MEKLHYCTDCKRVFAPSSTCTYCGSTQIKELVPKAPVSVIGAKQKGRLFKVESNKAHIIVLDGHKGKSIRDFEPSKIIKIL